MHVLAFDTSGPLGSLALWHDCGQGQLETFTAERGHNSALFAPLASLLPQATELELIAVGTGPGSYTGVRVGLSAALGFGLARKVPVIGIPSVCALVHAAAEERYAVVGDARRGSWWWAEVTHGRLDAPPLVGTAEETAARAAASTRRLYTPDAQSPAFCTAHVTWPRADILAQRAAALTEQECARLAAIPPEPLYLHAPFITQPKPHPFAGTTAAT